MLSVLLASGFEVSILIAEAKLLQYDGIRLQIVSVPSEVYSVSSQKNTKRKYWQRVLYKQVNGLL